MDDGRTRTDNGSAQTQHVPVIRMPADPAGSAGPDPTRPDVPDRHVAARHRGTTNTHRPGIRPA